MRTKNYVNILLENGIHFNTISKMGKRQVRLLAEKFEPKEAVTTTQQTGYKTKIDPGTKATLNFPADSVIEADPNKGITAISSTKPTGSGETTESEEIDEKFESKAQQKLFFVKCGDGKTKEQKKWCKLRDEFASSTTKKDYEDMPEYASDDDEKDSKQKRRKSRRKPTSKRKSRRKPTSKRKSRRRKSTNESYLESRISQMVEKHIEPSMTKGELLQLFEDKKKKEKEVITIRQHQMDDLHNKGYFISKGLCFIYDEDIKKYKDKDKLEKIERLKEKKGDDKCINITKKQMMMLHSDERKCECNKDITLKYAKPKKETKESFILKKPIKNSLFSHNEGLEMKKPIGRLTSLGMMEEELEEDTKTAPTKDPGTKERTKSPGRRNPFKRPGPKQKPRADEKEKQKSDFMSLIKQVLNMS